jgi:hypothetical protein
MNMKRLGLRAALLAAASGLIFGALAQVSVPLRGPLAANDLVQVIPYGQPSSQSVYATPGQISGLQSYNYQVPLTAFTLTQPDGTELMYLNPAGTLATGTLTMMAHPADGQRFILEDSQTQTAITIQANTGQTLTAGTYGLATPTALVANTSYVWVYFAAQAAWVRRS